MMNKTKRNIIIGVIVFIGVIFGYHKLVYSKNAKIINEKREEHKNMSVDLAKAEQVAKSLPNVQKRYEILVKQWDKAKEMLPSTKEIPSLLEAITRVGMKAGVKFVLFEPQSIRTPKGQILYSELPIKLSISGGFHQIGLFLSSIGNLPRIIDVSNLTMKISGTTVAANFVATTYILK